MTQTSGVANASRLRPGVCCLRHLACLSPRRKFNLASLRLNLSCILPGYARHSAAQRPASSFVFPISFTGGELRERAPARDLPRSRLHYTYPLRIRHDTARCGGAGPAPPLRLTCDLPRCPRHAPARDGGTDATLLRGLTRPRASAAPTTLRRPTPSACRLPCPYERCCAHGAAAVPTSRRRLNAPLPHPRRCGCSDTMPPALPTRTAATPTALRRSPTLRRRLTYPCAAAAPTVLRRP